jgi:hypothetical protein
MDPHSFSKLDPYPHSLKKLDPDPDLHKVNANPKHWVTLSRVIFVFRPYQKRKSTAAYLQRQIESQFTDCSGKLSCV